MQVRDPGGYQIRAAVLDKATAKVGSGSQFVEVSRVGVRRLAVSSVVMKGESATAQAEPTVRIFRPGSQAVYAYEIYAGVKRGDDLFTSCALLRDGRAVYVSPATPVRLDDGAGDAQTLRVIPIGGTLSLARDLPVGRYSLQVTVAAQHGAHPHLRASQWVDFELR
jgi:hypothetical protein